MLKYLLGVEKVEQSLFHSKTAVIVIDMLNDFVKGELSCEQSRAIVPPLHSLLSAARQEGVPIFYCNDCHIPDTDHELKLWGHHAISGTEGAEIVSELAPQKGDYIIPKHCYSGFFQTDLQWILTSLGIKNLIITGLYTNICVRHTAADAFCWGYQIYVPRDCVSAFTPQEYEGDIAYLKTVYGAMILSSDEIK